MPTADPILPEFLVDFAPSRPRPYLLPILSRRPATGRLADIWHTAALRAPDTAVVVDRPSEAATKYGTDLTYGTCADIVDEMAGRLYAAGVRAHHRVAVMKRNHLDVTLLASAVARLGAVPALMSDNHDRNTLDILLQRLQRPFLIADAQAIERVGIDPEIVRHTATTIVLDDGAHRPDITRWNDLPTEPAWAAPITDEDCPQVITHTSGTTGYPKLVMHSVASLHALALIESERWPILQLRPRDTVLFCDPYCHLRVIMGMLTMATVTPKLVCLSDPADPGVRAALIRHKPTFVETVPNGFMYWEPLAKDPEGPFSRVRVFASSFDGIHTRTVRLMLQASRRRFPLWVQSWSQSEAGAVAVRAYTRSTVRKVGKRPPPTQSLGWPVPGYAKLRSIDPATGDPVRPGEVGLIQISAPGRCLGYVGERARYEHKVHGTWWDLGDLGIINKWGAVRLIDREVDRIADASALEIEDVLLDRLPHTTEVVVLAVRDQLPQPVISTDDDSTLDPTIWRNASADLPAMADPIQIRWTEFPRTATWKVQRARLRQQVLTDATGIGTGGWT